MNLQSLRTFLIAGHHESLSAAANELLYAQSTVTTQIKQLESEWGVQLFRKQGRGVRLTPAGRVILAKVQTIVDQVDTLDQVVDSINSGGAGHLRIGVMEPLGSHLVAPILAEFTRDRDLLQINLETGSIYSLSDRLVNGELEFAVAHQPPWYANNDLPFEPLFKEKQSVLIREDHLLAEKEYLQIDDLRTVRLMFQDTVSGYNGVDVSGLSFHGSAHPFANIEMNSIDALITCVQRGVGVAILPEYCLTPVPQHCVVRVVDGHDFERTMGLLHSFGVISPVIQDLILLLRDRLKTL